MKKLAAFQGSAHAHFAQQCNTDACCNSIGNAGTGISLSSLPQTVPQIKADNIPLPAKVLTIFYH